MASAQLLEQISASRGQLERERDRATEGLRVAYEMLRGNFRDIHTVLDATEAISEALAEVGGHPAHDRSPRGTGVVIPACEENDWVDAALLEDIEHEDELVRALERRQL